MEGFGGIVGVSTGPKGMGKPPSTVQNGNKKKDDPKSLMSLQVQSTGNTSAPNMMMAGVGSNTNKGGGPNKIVSTPSNQDGGGLSIAGIGVNNNAAGGAEQKAKRR